MIDPLVTLAARWLLGLMFLGAAGHKWLDLPAFRAVLADYRLLPTSLVVPAALLLVTVESLLALAWLLAPWQPLLCVLTAVLLAAYAGGIAINLLRGRRRIDCGCGLGLAGTGLSWWLVLRNGGLIVLALIPALPATGRTLGLLDAFSLSAALALLALLLLALRQLRTNRSAIAAWRTAHE